jgi:hypothetical protein
MATITLTRVKLTARELVKQRCGKRNMCEQAVHDEVVQMMRRGWLTAFLHRRSEWDRRMVFIPQNSAFAGIIRYVDQRSIGVVPRGLIESRTGQPIESFGTGMFLAHMGIGITRIDGNNIFIRGTTSGLAMMAYQTRRHPMEQMRMETLVHATTGKHVPRRLWNDDLRLRVAMAFDDFDIDVPGVLDDELESDVRSRWMFPPEPPPTPPSGKPPPSSPGDPPPPAAPFSDPPIDPPF